METRSFFFFPDVFFQKYLLPEGFFLGRRISSIIRYVPTERRKLFCFYARRRRILICSPLKHCSGEDDFELSAGYKRGLKLCVVRNGKMCDGLLDIAEER